MARVTYVKHAQARYEMVPVLGDDGQPLRKPIDRKTKRSGRQVTVAVTVADKSKPLPPLVCERDRTHVINVGDPYKWVQPHMSGKRIRCDACPNWQPWELTNALWARLAQIESEFQDSLYEAESTDDVQAALDAAADAVAEIAEEKRESASNMEDGFGHSTSASDDLNGTADQLDDWAEEIRGAGDDIPEFPEGECEYEDREEGRVCTVHDESKVIDADEKCEQEGEPTEDQLSDWRDEVAGSLTIVGESPV